MHDHRSSPMRATWLLALGTVAVSIASSAVLVVTLSPDTRSSGVAPKLDPGIAQLQAEMVRLRETLVELHTATLAAPDGESLRGSSDDWVPPRHFRAAPARSDAS